MRDAEMVETESGALLRLYAALASASEEMLDAARRGDWDSVCRIEAACVVVIARLRALASKRGLAPGEQMERMRMLRLIIANDAEIRRIATPQPALLERVPVLAGAPAGTTLH